MILILFALFLSLSLILIILGLFKPEHTELSLVGFLFLFLLSFTVMNNNLEYQTGHTINYTYTDDNYSLNPFSETLTYNYEYYNDTSSSFNTHILGYYLALISVVGFIGCILGLRKSKRFE